MTIAPKSSIMANAVKKTFKDIGTLFPNKDKTPNDVVWPTQPSTAGPNT